MADYIVKDTELTSVANAIRTAGGTNSLLNFPNGFVNAVNNISGGSSDFSIANVTIVNNTGDLETAFKNCPIVFEANEFAEGAPAMLYYTLGNIPAGATVMFHVPLYKGTCIWNNNPFGEMVTHSMSGNIVKDNGMYIITGDCTITTS